MKKVILTLALALIVMGATAQKLASGSFQPLKGQRYVKFAIEYVTIHGMTEKDYAIYEPAWPKD